MKRTVFPIVIVFLLLTAFAGNAAEIIPPAYEVPPYVEWLLSVAAEELGNGRDKTGATKYGIWAGNPKTQWCAEFQCWCVDQTDKRFGTSLLKNVYPLYFNSNVGRAFFIEKGRYINRRGHMYPIEGGAYQWYKGADRYMEPNSYIPQPGDWMYFTWTAGTDTDHVAMVEYCTREKDGTVRVHTIEGNNPTVVARKSYKLTDKSILGYGTVFDLADWTLRYRDKGEKVYYLQKRLAYLGFLEDTLCDGSFGRLTMAAVSAFQTEGMKAKRATGIADLPTQNAINAACAERLRTGYGSSFLVIDDDP